MLPDSERGITVLNNKNNDNNNNNTFYLRSAFQDTQGYFTGEHQNKTMDKKHQFKTFNKTTFKRPNTKKEKHTINNIQNSSEHTVYNN